MASDIRRRVPAPGGTILGLDRAGCLPALGVAFVALFFAAGLPAIDRLVPGLAPIAPGTLLQVGMGVTVTPAGGWKLNRSAQATVPGSRIELTNGGTRFRVFVEPYSGTAQARFEQVSNEIAKAYGIVVPGSGTAVATRGGLRGLRGAFTSLKTDGVYAVFVTRATAIIATALQPRGANQGNADDVAAMIDSIAVGP